MKILPEAPEFSGKKLISFILYLILAIYGIVKVLILDSPFNMFEIICGAIVAAISIYASVIAKSSGNKNI